MLREEAMKMRRFVLGMAAGGSECAMGAFAPDARRLVESGPGKRNKPKVGMTGIQNSQQTE